MTLYKNLIALFVSLSILAVPALALARESSADLDTDVNASIGIAHPGLTSGVLLGGDGTVVVNGATVDSNSSSTVTAHSSVGSTIFNWILNTSSTTKVKEQGTSSGAVADIKSGDTISFAGILSSIGGAFTVSAQEIRDWTHAAASTTASTTISHGDNGTHGKHNGWFRNWFHLFSGNAGANAHFSVQPGN
jgi:hypothetical protein